MGDKKIRVVIGANDLLLAGVQRLVIDQLRTLDRTKFDLHLIVLMDFPGRASFHNLIPDDVSVHQLAFRGLADIGSWWKLAGILGKIKPDVVKTATFFSNTVFLLLKPLFGYGVVAAEHNTVQRKPAWQRFVDRLLYPTACTVIGDSEQVVAFVTSSEHIDRKHFTVVPNGVDIEAVRQSERQYASRREEIRAELGIPASAHITLNVGRLVKQKNHALTIDAVAEVPGLYLLIVGEGALRPELEAQIKERNVVDRIRLIGVQSEVHKYYAVADSFLLTSHHEGFCIAAMEGLAFGLPLISTRVAGVVGYLKDGVNGYFVEDTVEDVAKKLVRVSTMSPEERTRYGAAARLTASEYGIDRYGAHIQELLTKCAA